MTYEKRNEIYQKARALMNQYGLNQWAFQWDRSKRRLGCCNHRRQVISISEPIASVNTVERILQTVLHEIAHALTPGHNHDYVWQRKAVELGCPPTRCSSDSLETVTVKGRYKLTCPNGHESFRHKRTRGTKSCGRCSRRFDPRFILTWSLA